MSTVTGLSDFLLATGPLPEPHLLVSPEGEVAGVNPAATRLLHLDGLRIAPLRLGDLCTDPPERLAAYLRACASSGALLPGAMSLRDGRGVARRYRCDGALARPRGAGGGPLVLLRFRPHEEASRRFLLLNRKLDELAHEVDRRRRAEAELQAQAAQLERINTRLRVLAEAGRLLTSTLDHEAALRGLAELCTTTIADYCVTYLREADGSIRRVSATHADPAALPLVVELLHQRPPAADAPDGIGAVIRTGTPVLATDVDDETLRALTSDAGYLDVLLRLAPRSSIIVPMRAGERTLGALSVATVEGGRSRYTEDDLAVLQQLAGRAALLVAGARAHAELAETHELLQQQAAELEMQAEELQAQTAEMEATQLELERANDELREQSRMARDAADLAERARREAEEANRAKAQFLATMSHELRTPLNAIGGYVDLIDLGIHGPVTDAQRHGLSRVRRNQQHLLILINDILNFARLEAGRVEFRRDAVRLAPLLGNLEVLIEPQVRAKSISYACVEADPTLAVWGDEERIHQVLINLLTNATKFTGAGGRVGVACDAGPVHVHLRVHDTGPGIPAERLESIFDPFVQLGRGAEDDPHRGVGLGLAISRDLARHMGGDLTVESREGEGSVFTLTLRRAEAGSPAA